MIAAPFVCVLCDRTIKGEFGNNPDPLASLEDGQCCDSCNEKVTAARIAIHQARKDCRISKEVAL